MEIELRNKIFIRLDNKARYLFNRYMVTITERSGKTVEREYKVVNRGAGVNYIALDGLYYKIHLIDEVLSIELSGGTIELINEKVLKDESYHLYK